MKHLNKLVCATLAMTVLAAQADVFFDNSLLYNGNQFVLTSGQPVGNEVTLGSGIYLTNFMFEYYSPNLTLNANLGVDVQFYLNNGALGAPGTLFYDSGWYFNNVAGNIPVGSNDLSYAYADLYSSGLPGAFNMNPLNPLPTDFTYVITFTNILGSETIEIPLANNTSGVNSGNYWLYDSGQWSLLATNGIPANFVSEFAGTPEPSAYALVGVGGALLLGLNKLRRKI